MNRRAELELEFPGLRGTNWVIKSRRTKRYNCFAWAARERHRRWDFGKGAYWPKSVRKLRGIAYLVAAFRVEGFVPCSRADCQSYDEHFDRIVLYEKYADGEHAARLLHNGMWSSKLGDDVDIQHPTPEAVGGLIYGDPVVYMQRDRRLFPKRRRKKGVLNEQYESPEHAADQPSLVDSGRSDPPCPPSPATGRENEAESAVRTSEEGGEGQEPGG